MLSQFLTLMRGLTSCLGGWAIQLLHAVIAVSVRIDVAHTAVATLAFNASVHDDEAHSNVASIDILVQC